MSQIDPSVSAVDLSRVRGVLFDLGGTLDGDGEHWLNRFWLLYQKHFPHLDFEAVKAAFYQAEEACLTDPRVASSTLPRLVAYHVERQLAALGYQPEAGEKLAWEFLEGCRRVIRRNAYVLRDLAQDYRLGVVTNGYGNASLLLAGEAIALWFAVIVDSARVGVRKPDPEIFRLAARELGFPPAEVVYVGDSYTQDIRPAKEVGFITVWLRKDDMNAPLPPDAGLSLADFEIRSLPELQGLLP